MIRCIFLMCFLVCGSWYTKAQSEINGVRIEAGTHNIVVFLNGSPVAGPASSCFIANLRSGYYQVEVYDVDHLQKHQRWERGKKIYNKDIYYDGKSCKNIELYDGISTDVSRPPFGHINGDRKAFAMSPGLFERFYKDVKSESFDDGKLKLIELALAKSWFSSEQCCRLSELLSFDDNKVKFIKLVYPKVVDQEGFFQVINTLTFSANKQIVYDYILERK